MMRESEQASARATLRQAITQGVSHDERRPLASKIRFNRRELKDLN